MALGYYLQLQEKNYNVTWFHVIYDVLGEHIISHIAVFAEMWKTQGKSLKAIYINSTKHDQG